MYCTRSVLRRPCPNVVKTVLICVTAACFCLKVCWQKQLPQIYILIHGDFQIRAHQIWFVRHILKIRLIIQEKQFSGLHITLTFNYIHLIKVTVSVILKSAVWKHNSTRTFSDKLITTQCACKHEFMQKILVKHNSCSIYVAGGNQWSLINTTETDLQDELSIRAPAHQSSCQPHGAEPKDPGDIITLSHILWRERHLWTHPADSLHHLKSHGQGLQSAAQPPTRVWGPGVSERTEAQDGGTVAKRQNDPMTVSAARQALPCGTFF